MTTSPIIGRYASGATRAVVRPDGIDLTGTTGEVSIRFALPPIGRPHFPPPFGGATTGRVLDGGALTAAAAGTVPDLDALVRTALAGRLALIPTGGGAAVPLELGQPQPGDSDEPGTVLLGYPLHAAIATTPGTAGLVERTLYDIAIRIEGATASDPSSPSDPAAAGGPGTWHVLAPHAIYYRGSWADFGIAHISDSHVARRIDQFRPTLHDLGRHEAAERMVNWNDRFRGFVRYANALHDAGELDVIVATGDLFDYQFEVDDDPDEGGNAAFLRRLILGTAPGPDFQDVAELRVPILMTPGNHEYRRAPYHLVFDVELAGIGVRRIRNFSGYHLREPDAMALGNALYFPGGSHVPGLGRADAEAMVAVEPTLRTFREQLADTTPHVVELGPHRIVLVDSAHDVGMVTSIWDAVRAWFGTLDEDEATFVGGSPNCEGVSDEEYAVAVAALSQAPPEGLVILGLHAPLVNIWNTEYPYFLRESQRPHLDAQAWWFVARHTKPLATLDKDWVRDRHPQWFGHPSKPPAYVKRGDTADLLDFGVSRGRSDDLLRMLAGDGTPDGRRGDVVLAGHTHHHNELTMRPVEGGLAFYHDFYTQNPRRWYPSRFVTADDVQRSARSGASTNPPRYSVATTTTYVEVDPDALPGLDPWPMPTRAHHEHIVQVPPYAGPLDEAPDARDWWDGHRPLLLQTGALGPMENHQVSFSGFRLLTVRDNVIQRIRFVSIETLEQHGFDLPLDRASAVEPPRAVRHVERSRRFGSPVAGAGAACVVLPGAAATHSLVYRDRDGFLTELWDVPGSAGAGRLAGADLAPPASTSVSSDPVAYRDPLGVNVVVYRAGDGSIHSLYWSGTQAAGHDALSAAAGTPTSAGRPTAYALAGMNHIIYRGDDGRLHELSWTGTDAVSGVCLSDYVEAPRASGDPCGYPVTTASGAVQNVVVYRGDDGHVHSLYWSDGPTGHDALSGYVGSPPAAGDPVGYYRADDDSHQVVYRGVDGHLYEIWWVGAAPASVWDLTATAGGPAAASDPSCWYVPESGIKHVVYAGTDGHVHDLAWAPGGGIPVWTDLTAAAAAPPADGRPVVFSLPGSPQCRVVYRGRDEHLHELRWD